MNKIIMLLAIVVFSNQVFAASYKDEKRGFSFEYDSSYAVVTKDNIWKIMGANDFSVEANQTFNKVAQDWPAELVLMIITSDEKNVNIIDAKAYLKGLADDYYKTIKSNYIDLSIKNPKYSFDEYDVKIDGKPAAKIVLNIDGGLRSSYEVTNIVFEIDSKDYSLVANIPSGDKKLKRIYADIQNSIKILEK